ncbi:MAG: LysM peptidoglycan-binding domain-containing protein [Candidatus Kerfeldbacteria bacterium]|nr:LysM peptidoglycan-binding domain-containing protein [Candidatus Kerfeldbacteria bacterium]
MKKQIVVMAIAVGVGFLLASPISVHAIEYGGIGGRPANPRADNPRTQDIFVYTLESGSSYDDGIVVINNTQEEKTIYLYSADSTPSSDGGFACKQYLESTKKLSTDKNGVGSWITFAVVPQERLVRAPDALEGADTDGDSLTDAQEVEFGTDPTEADTDGDGDADALEVAEGNDPLQPVVLTLAPVTNAVVPFTIQVPQDADVGELDGCILIQEKPKAQDATAEGISIATRTGLRVSVTIPGEIRRQLEIIGLTVTPQTNWSAVIRPTVRNSGNVSVDALVRVVTKNFLGQMVADHGGEYSILRETTSSWNYELPAQFWGGWFHTTMMVDYDRDATLELGKTGVDHVQLSGPTVTFFLMPSLYALLIYGGVMLLLIFLAGVWWWTRRRKLWIEKTWVSYKIKKGDTVKSIVKRYNVSWQLLVKVNRMKAPFDLTPGTSIKVPPPTP